MAAATTQHQHKVRTAAPDEVLEFGNQQRLSARLVGENMDLDTGSRSSSLARGGSL
jgi:hypothetical protein